MKEKFANRGQQLTESDEPDVVLDSDYMKRDTFNLHKMIVVATAAGKVQSSVIVVFTTHVPVFFGLACLFLQILS